MNRWVAGARPRTLPAAVVPVLVGTAAAVGEGDIIGWRMLAALVVSLALQVGTNYANDYSDGVRGTDDERVGPVRLVASKLASPAAVKRAAFVAFGVAALAGTALALATTPWLFVVGGLAIAAGWFYTGGPKPYGYYGFGELFVFVFFGLVATVGSTFVQIERITGLAVAAGVAVGFGAVALLVVNNLRDIPTDRFAGKKTLAVRIGEKRTRGLYVVLVVGALLVAALTALDRPPALLAVVSAVFATTPLPGGGQGRPGAPARPGARGHGPVAARLRCAVRRGALARRSLRVVSAAMPKRYRREGSGIEFDRVAFFTDAVFAIAITLLVVEVGLPEIAEGLDRDSAEHLLDATREKLPVIVSFFVGCWAIGGYWMANHRFTARLGSVDGAQIALVVVYLAFVAFLPFAVGTLGEYISNPLSVVIFAVNLGIVSTMEVVLYWRAGRVGLFEPPIPPDVQRWEMLMSASPVVVFALSIPIAFIRPWLGVLTWTLSIPFQILLSRWRPADAAAYE